MAKFTPHTDAEIKEMLSVSGVSGIEALFRDIPKELRPKSFNLPAGMTEYEAMDELSRLSSSNKASKLTVFAGGGYYDHFIPAAVDAISSRAEFYTAYTPYQPEASQGTLQAIFEYQTMMATLAGLDFSNASLYDGGTALYEAVAMAVRTNNRSKIVMDAGVNPLYRRILKTYAINLDIEFITVNLKEISADTDRIKSLLAEDVSALVLQNPNWFGIVDDYSDLFEAAAAKNITKILVYYPMSLGTLKSPGEMKADIAVADGQSLGQYLSFGGPYLGIMAATKGYVRKMPGRIVGETVDKNGKKVYVLTLQAREQHIRREKATSNICSNQALCALRSTVYLSLLGKDGFRKVSLLNLERAQYMKESLKKAGVNVLAGPTYNEFSVKLPCDAAVFVKKMEASGFMAGVPASIFFQDKKDILVIAATEKRSKKEIDAYVAAFKSAMAGAK
ncbi:MAG: aminomethyl-transferring glycine dehydrogenase subunit GcvPA [Spirochaetia bacterium]|nr:aminomethyl-transferring glycine dehydrogenase subunit GcvPA [Spirochaetia bacterium]